MLRLIALQCSINGGIKPKNLNLYKKDILQTYGFRYIKCLDNFEKAMLIYTKVDRKQYYDMLKRYVYNS